MIIKGIEVDEKKGKGKKAYERKAKEVNVKNGTCKERK